MPDTVTCPRCARTGLIRYETVIKAGKAERQYYCGACQFSWAVEDAVKPRPKKQPPKRSR